MRKAMRNLLLLPTITLIGTAAVSLATPGVGYAETVEPIFEPAGVTQSAIDKVSLDLDGPSLNEVSHMVRDEIDELMPFDPPTGEGCVRIAFGICYYPDPDDLLR